MSLSNKGLLFGVAAAAFIGPFTQTVYVPSLPELGSFFQVNTVMVNLTISLYTSILALANLVVGPMADRWGRRALLLPGLLLFSLGSLVCLFAASYWVFLAGRAVQAMGVATAMLVAPTVIGDLYPPQERPAAMSVYQTLTFLGPVFGPVVGGLIAAYLHWQWVFGLLAAAGILVWLYNRSHLVETLPKDAVPTPITLRAFRGVLGNRSALSIIVLGFSQFFGYYLFLVFLPSLTATLFAQTVSAAGFFFLPLTAGILVGINIGGRLHLRWGRVKMVAVASFGIAANVLAFWLALVSGWLTLTLLLAFLLVYGLLLGASLPVQSAILVNLFQKEKATAVGSYNFFRFAGAASGPLAGGAISMAYGVNAVFLTLGIVLVFAAWVVQRNLADPYDAR